MDNNTLKDSIEQALKAQFDAHFIKAEMDYDFPVFTVKVDAIHDVLSYLKQTEGLGFHFLTTLCVIHMPDQTGAEFGVMYQLHNMHSNQRIRVKTWLSKDNVHIPTASDLWPAANWYEREAFDLFGFMFTDHPDLRRILTDYGFVGYPFRKDFPMIGKVEMRYDDVQKRVVYQPVSIEERNNVPRIIREEGFHNG